jgi:DNA polymerase I
MSLLSRLHLPSSPVFLIDGTSFLYRAFYAFPDLKRSDGFPTNALFIVLRLLLRLWREEQPRFAGFFLDGRGPTFRHELFPAYKAQRLKTPETLVQQIEPLIQGVKLFGLNVQVSEGVEADDLIASLCTRFKTQRPVVIVGSDKDLMQCLDSNVFLWDPGLKTEKLVTSQSFQQEHAIEPRQWPDFQALTGDSSDNIPGIPGVGPKTAKGLMQRFPSLEALRDNQADLLPKERKKIDSSLEQVFTYRELTRLRTDLQPEARLEDYTWQGWDNQAMLEFLRTYEFRSLERDMSALFPKTTDTDAEVRLVSKTTGSGHRPATSPAGRGVLSATNVSKPNPARPVSSLPDLSGKHIALVPAQGGWLVALDGEELLWTDGVHELVAAVSAANKVAVHSWKQLLRTAPAFSSIAMERRFDVSLAAYLLQPEERDYSLFALARAYQHELDAKHAPGAAGRTGDGVGDGAGQGLRGLLILDLAKLLERATSQAELLDLMRTLEMPLIPVLVAMEEQGVLLDKTALRAFLQEVEGSLEQLSRSIHAHAGKPFNLRSSQQLAEVLFQDLGLRTGRKTPGGSRSTSMEVLEKLADEHPIVPEILEYRKLEKLRSTYLEPLPRLADHQGRVHTTFNQTAVATGRLSSSNPNLQNIPIRGPMGHRMRACFTAPSGQQLISADYSQIELRVLAHLSADPHLQDLFARGMDVHAGTAALLFAKQVEQVTTEERRKAKTINFGLLYGMGPQKLGQELGISLAQAKDFIALYFMRLQKVRDFYEEIVEQAKERGAVHTLAGRRRTLPDINSRNANQAQIARRMAINTVVQGSAADIIKMAMIRVHADEVLRGLQARMILQVHDELLLEVPEKDCRQAGTRVAELMAGVVSLDVPLLADWGCGANWAVGH